MDSSVSLCLNSAMSYTLVTGFTPFDGRTVNASWIAARSLEGRDRAIRAIEVPVIWGKPGEMLTPIVQQDCPHTIIAMGEGRPGWFDIETVARNRRDERGDNAGTLPEGRPVFAGGAPRIDATIDSRAVTALLEKAGYPTRISTDAGAFLCEEMLYTLERLRAEHATLQTVIFTHLPPYGTAVHVSGSMRPCTESLLAAFAGTLLDAVADAAHQKENMDNA